MSTLGRGNNVGSYKWASGRKDQCERIEWREEEGKGGRHGYTGKM